MAVIVKVKGEFKKTKNFLGNITARGYLKNLHALGRRGVAALAAATPVDTGETAISWDYEIIEEDDTIKIIWTNDNMVDNDTPLVILLQYGHGTRNGGYVVGRDFINPAIRPIFDQIADDAWMEVKKA